MSAGRFPGPYVNDVREDKTLMIYDFQDWGVMGIGARKSGQPAAASSGPRPLVHVGESRVARQRTGGQDG